MRDQQRRAREVSDQKFGRSFRVLVFICLGATSCGESAPEPTAPGDDLPTLPPPSVTVMTRNLFVGADLDPAALSASPLTLPFVVADAFAAMLESRFPERAVAIAQEIKAANPHVIALQEVSLIRTQSPGDFVSGGNQPATDVAVDFMAVLLDALAAEGLSYTVASIVENADVEVPMSSGFLSFDDVRLTDFDAILVRQDVRVIDSDPASFQAALSFAVGSDTVSVRRGWATISAEIDGQQYRFVSTHLEPADNAIRQLQAAELIAQWVTESLPVVLMGDFNSSAPSGPSYQTLVQAGYLDSWTLQDSSPLGLTCCQAADLRNTVSELTARIDLILVRNPAFSLTPLVEPAQADVVGEELDDRTPTGLWPSDHAGAWAEMRVRR